MAATPQKSSVMFNITIKVAILMMNSSIYVIFIIFNMQVSDLHLDFQKQNQMPIKSER